MINAERYDRQTLLIGDVGQAALSRARVLCVGAGGLASSALAYLAAAGVGYIGVVDGDKVELSNLPRQILYTESQVGKKKVSAVQEALLARNATVMVTPYDSFLTKENAESLIAHYDLVIDTTDNYETKYLINTTCYALNKPYILGSVLQFSGQLALFTPETPCYRCLFPEEVSREQPLRCSDAGVLGMVPGVIGALQALEAIKFLVGLKEATVLQGRLFSADMLAAHYTTWELEGEKDCPICGTNKYTYAMHQKEENTLVNTILENTTGIPSIKTEQLRDLYQSGKIGSTYAVLDVRTEEEHAVFHLPGWFIPVATLQERVHELDREKTWIVYCKSGMRSARAVQILQASGVNSVFNLEGGILAWISHYGTETVK